MIPPRSHAVLVRPGSLRAGAPAALRRGQRNHIALLYGLGERPERLAHAYDVPTSRIHSITTDRNLVPGAAAGEALTAKVDAVHRLARVLVPLPEEERNIRAAVLTNITRLLDWSDTEQRASLVADYSLLIGQQTAKETITTLGMDADQVADSLTRGRLPVVATLYALAGMNGAEASRLDHRPLDVPGLRLLAVMRGHAL